MINVLGGDGEAKLLIETGAVCFQPGKTIEFTSGIKSPGCYIDSQALVTHQAGWHNVLLTAQLFFDRDEIEFDTIAGVEFGGVTHAAALAWSSRVPLVTVRKAPKDHGGAPGMITGGPDAVRGRRVLLVEDIATTGKSSFSAVTTLRESGAAVTDMLVLVAYGFPEFLERAEEMQVNVHTICMYEHVLDAGVSSGKVGASHEQRIRSWLNNPRAEWQWP